MLEAFLYPLLWVLGFGVGLIAIGLVAFLGFCWLRWVAGDDDDDGVEER